MAYLAPAFIPRRIFNPIAMRLGIGGSVGLEVPGRRTGRPLRVPVIPVEHDAHRYVVSTRGESHWVRNLRAGGRATLRSRGGSEAVRAIELPVAERPPVIAAYRARAGRQVEGYWKKLPAPADHPVFRLEAAPRGR